MTDQRTPNGGVHPAADLFPMMEQDDFDALVEDIRRHGLIEPVWIMPDGRLLDGRNRAKACREAGVDLAWRVYAGDDPIGFVLSLNLKRRHLTVGQKAMLALDVLGMYEAEGVKRKSEGGVVGASITNNRQPNERDGAPVPHPGERAPRSRDRAADAVGVSGRAVAQAKRIAQQAPDLAEKVKTGELELKTAEKEVRGRVAKQSYIARKAEWDRDANSAGDRWQVRHGDFRDILAGLEPGSVDAIITDPPYPDEFLPLWADLAEHAARVLRPGAPLIAWSGQYRLQAVLNHLCGPLRYQWTLCLDMPGANSRFRGPNMIQTWKPIIVATAGQWGPHDWQRDRVVSPSKDQALYEWQQNPDPAAELIRRYVPEGGLVVDPFAGVGSFGIAAIATGRRFLGVELDDERHMTACERLKDAA